MILAVFVGLGEKLGERFLPLYLEALGGTAIVIGLLGAMDNFLSAVYSLAGGLLADRLGTRRSLLVFNLLAMAGFAIVIVVPTWWAVLAGAACFLSWTAISLPATMSLVHRAVPPSKRTMGVSMHSMARRIPMALGPILGGLFIDAFGTRAGMQFAFGCALVLTALATAAQMSLIPADSGSETASRKALPQRPLHFLREMPPALRHLLIADILVRFCEQIPYSFVVIWCLRVIAEPVDASRFGVLTGVEMVTAMLVYAPVAWFADRSGKKPFVLVTFMFFSAFPVVLLFSHTYVALIGAFIVRGLKEFGDATRKALILDLAPEDRKAASFGLYYLVRDSIVSIAALAGGWLWLISPTVNLLTAFGFGLAGTAWFARFGSDLSALARDGAPPHAPDRNPPA